MSGREGSDRGLQADLRAAIDRYHSAVIEVGKGNADPIKQEVFSRLDDVTLANPFGPAVHGWKNVSDALDIATAALRDGEVTFQPFAEYRAGDLVSMFEVEHWKVRVRDRNEIDEVDLRVTSTLRLEGGTWKLAHRHADPISTFHPDGPLRPS